VSSEDWARGLGWTSFEEQQFASLGRQDDSIFRDNDLRNAYDIGWFNHDVDTDYRKAARDFVIEWLDIEYGIDFDAQFDWDEWRERYAGG
jgi:hypothetical protein